MDTYTEDGRSEGNKGTKRDREGVFRRYRVQIRVSINVTTFMLPAILHAWPVVVCVGSLWLFFCVALLVCAGRDVFLRWKEKASSREHPATALYRRNSQDEDGLSDILAVESIDAADYYELGDPHAQPTLAYPIPGRANTHSHVHYDPSPRRPHLHASISTTPTGPSSGLPILAWSAAAD
jgi:hypothetical protein